MLHATEMFERLSMLARSPAFYLYPWVLASIVWMKSSGFQSDQIPFDIPVVQLYDFSHPDKIPEKDFPYAIDGERYYFTKQVPRDASGKRSKRKAGKAGAHWKSTSKDIEIPFPDSEGKPIGYLRKYTLYEDMNDKGSADWYMEEYRVLDPDGLADPYTLCKIYDKGSSCPTYTRKSILTLRKRSLERQLGSHPDQTNSQFDNMNQSQTQVEDSNFPKDLKQATFPPLENFPPQSILPNPGPPSYSNEHAGFSDLFSMSREHVIMQPTLPTSVHPKKTKKTTLPTPVHRKKIKKTTLPTSASFPRESILPTSGPPSDGMVFPMVHDLSNECSMSRDPSGNLNPPESIRPIPVPPDYSNGFSMSHDLSGNLNLPESTLLIPGRPCYSNDFPMCGGISNDFSMSHDLSGNLNPPESTLLIPERPCCSNEFPMFRGISNGFSMSRNLSGNLNPPESTLLIPDRPCCSNGFPMCGGISNDFSMSHDTSRNLNPPESTLLIPERPCCSNEFPMFRGISNGFSMSRNLSGNLNPPESTLLIPDRPCYSNELGISNEFSMSQDPSGILNTPDCEESPLDCCSQLWNHGSL